MILPLNYEVVNGFYQFIDGTWAVGAKVYRLKVGKDCRSNAVIKQYHQDFFIPALAQRQSLYWRPGIPVKICGNAKQDYFSIPYRFRIPYRRYPASF